MLHEFYRYLGQKIVEIFNKVEISKKSKLTVDEFDMSVISSNTEWEFSDCLKLIQWHAMNSRKK